MCASYYQRIMLAAAVLFAVSGFSVVVLAADNGDPLLPVVVPEPPSAGRLVTYNEFSEIAATTETAAQGSAANATVNGTCCPTSVSCESGCGSDCGCEPRWILGVEAVWLSPQPHGQFADYVITDANDIVLNQYNGAFGGLFITPRITLGYQGACWGIQGRYWRMSEANNQYLLPSDPLSLNRLRNDSLFKAETADLEVTRLFYVGDTTNLLSFGVCYAELNNAAGLSVMQELNGGLFMGSAYSRQNISGVGLTLGLAGYKPLQCRCFSLFYSVRGSVIWDDSTLNAVETQALFLDDAGGAGSINGAIASSNASLFIGEIQVGTQWNFPLVCNRADAFVRLALEYQCWDSNDTGFAGATSFAGDLANVGTATATSGSSRVDLFGFTVATGFTW